MDFKNDFGKEVESEKTGKLKQKSAPIRKKDIAPSVTKNKMDFKNVILFTRKIYRG